eukprot:scaffold1277_cov253-Pinguiococcus_pyrenoidosus.AAC.4
MTFLAARSRHSMIKLRPTTLSAILASTHTRSHPRVSSSPSKRIVSSVSGGQPRKSEKSSSSGASSGCGAPSAGSAASSCAMIPPRTRSPEGPPSLAPPPTKGPLPSPSLASSPPRSAPMGRG